MRNILILLTLILVSCGPDSKHFAIDGQLLNLNQGEFVIYSPDGAMNKVDTIDIRGGRFDYEGVCEREGTAVIILPNGQNIPVFVAPGKSYTVKGNAQNLKDLTVKGEKDNDIMNKFRKQIASLPQGTTPTKQVTDVVEKNPESVVCGYIVRNYLVDCDKPDYVTADKLLTRILKARPEDAMMKVLQKKVADLKAAAVGQRLPQFAVKDVNDKSITTSTVSEGTWIMCTFASWDYETVSKLRRISSVKRERNAEWNILALSFDASKVQCKHLISLDSDDFTIVCDGEMSESPIVSKLLMYQFPYCVIAVNGKIHKRGMLNEDMHKYIQDELKVK